MICTLYSFLNINFILGKDGPEYAVGPIMPVTKDNVREAWDLTKRIPIPEGLGEALEKAGLWKDVKTKSKLLTIK